MRFCFQDDKRNDVRQDERLRNEGSSREFSPRCEFEGSVGSKIVTVMCCRSKCVGNPKVVVKR